MCGPAWITHVATRFNVERFKRSTYAHVRRWLWAYLLVTAIAVVLQYCFVLGINSSPSLPHRLYVIHKRTLPAKGDLVAFRWPGGGPYRTGATFVKILAGTPGDTVTRVDRDFYVNGMPVGTAKPASLTGIPLEPGPQGILPPGRYYVRAPHADSLDSRYALTGWIDQAQIIGRAYAIF
jgi:conjugal transfer pilin signal peptidase TrbI